MKTRLQQQLNRHSSKIMETCDCTYLGVFVCGDGVGSSCGGGSRGSGGGRVPQDCIPLLRLPPWLLKRRMAGTESLSFLVIPTKGKQTWLTLGTSDELIARLDFNLTS